MKLLKSIKRSALIALAKADEYRVLHHIKIDHIKLADFASSLADSSAYYFQVYCSFHRELPEALRIHRQYFTKDGRGFGEEMLRRDDGNLACLDVCLIDHAANAAASVPRERRASARASTRSRR